MTNSRIRLGGTQQAELVADVEGQVKVRIDGSYLAQVLKACGGMLDFKLTNGYSPMLFSQNGYQVVVMPMLTILPSALIVITQYLINRKHLFPAGGQFHSEAYPESLCIFHQCAHPQVQDGPL